MRNNISRDSFLLFAAIACTWFLAKDSGYEKALRDNKQAIEVGNYLTDEGVTEWALKALRRDGMREYLPAELRAPLASWTFHDTSMHAVVYWEAAGATPVKGGEKADVESALTGPDTIEVKAHGKSWTIDFRKPEEYNKVLRELNKLHADQVVKQ